MEIVGYVGAIIIGVILGLIGGGGSILTVPIFVYILGINPVLATAYSLFVVGATALVGAIRNAQNQLVDFRTGFHGFHVFSGVVLLIILLINTIKGTYEKRGHYEMVEKIGLYWHFVDLVWVFVFTFFYLV